MKLQTAGCGHEGLGGTELQSRHSFFASEHQASASAKVPESCLIGKCKPTSQVLVRRMEPCQMRRMEHSRQSNSWPALGWRVCFFKDTHAHLRDYSHKAPHLLRGPRANIVVLLHLLSLAVFLHLRSLDQHLLFSSSIATKTKDGWCSSISQVSQLFTAAAFDLVLFTNGVFEKLLRLHLLSLFFSACALSFWSYPQHLLRIATQARFS